MKFEEQFPSLAVIDFTDRYKSIGKVCRCKDIKEHCTDNQLIIKAIDKCFEKHAENIENYHNGITKTLPMDLFPMIKRELGLSNSLFGMEIKTDDTLKENEFRFSEVDNDNNISN